MGCKQSTKKQQKQQERQPSRNTDDTLTSEPWYFGKLERSHCDRLLLMNGQCGSFLISKDRSDKYSLSVRGTDSVKHYSVCTTASDTGYYIFKHLQFPTLQELVEYYKNDTTDGLTIHLISPCAREEEVETQRDTIQLLSRLGKGQFGDVWEGIWNETTAVAVKVLQPDSIIPESLLTEAHILKKLRHPRLVELYAVCTKQQPLYIISELMPCGSLLHYLRGRSSKLPQLIAFAEQIANGMVYLEMKKYVHGELAAKNVLIKNDAVKIADVGLFRMIDLDLGIEEESTCILPFKWMAPEVFLCNRYTTKSDVWSYGILLYEVMTQGRTPYADVPFFDFTGRVLEGNCRIPCPKDCPEQIYKIMQDCWNKKPLERPSFKNIQSTVEEFLTFAPFHLESQTPSSTE